jgi:hypothetical protein
MDLVHARIVQDECSECRDALLEEAKSLKLPLAGTVVIIPSYWLNAVCPHGRPGLRFELATLGDGCGRQEGESGKDELQAFDSATDATKDMGFTAREHGPYGSHPMHDDFNEESDPDGSGKYPGLERNKKWWQNQDS